jgi:hypothetical protein
VGTSQRRTVVPPSDGAQPAGREPAPGGLALVQDFVNTMNHEFEAAADRLGTAARARAWLRSRRLLPDAASLSEREAATARELREALRELLRAHTDGAAVPAGARRTLEQAGTRARLGLRVARSGRPELRPGAPAGRPARGRPGRDPRAPQGLRAVRVGLL